MANGSYVGGGAYLDVDMSDVQRKIDLLRGILTREQFEKLIHRTFNEVGKRSKTMISREVPREYYAQRKWAASQVGRYRLTHGGIAPVTCVIPLKGAKGTIGGRFSASGGHDGIRISAQIVRGQRTILPAVMKNQGGNPPFINAQSAKLNGVAFTRRGEGRLPIVRVVGLGVPQMPLNQSAEPVQDALLSYAAQRLEHNFYHMLETGFK